MAGLIYETCPHARSTAMALEFGTVPLDVMIDAVRGDAWLRGHPGAAVGQAAAIRSAMGDAFVSGSPLWQGMVIGQSRVAIIQAICGLPG